MTRTMLVLLAVGGTLTSASFGFDAISASWPLSRSAFDCLVNSGYEFFIGRVGQSNGKIDMDGVRNIKNALDAGFIDVDAHIFPCHTSSCEPAKTQVNDTVNALRDNNAEFGTLWVDVKIYNWPTDLSANRQFILDMVEQCKDMGVSVGIYTTKWDWDNIVGSWNGVASLPLWWANYNGDAGNYKFFVPFGGWSEPAMHQYLGDINGACSVGSVNLNYKE